MREENGIREENVKSRSREWETRMEVGRRKRRKVEWREKKEDGKLNLKEEAVKPSQE